MALLPKPIPAAIKNFANEIALPVALVGCHTSEMSFDCCEYDMALLTTSEKYNQSNQVLLVADHPVELMCIKGSTKNHIVDLAQMVILNDNSEFVLSSISQSITAEKYKKVLTAEGKKLLVSCILCQQKMKEAKCPILAAAWLKIAAYEFIDGMLALSGKKPMPLHILEQMRQNDAAIGEDGLEVALDCIGTERATRPAIVRSIRAINELKSKDYDRDLVVTKANYLLDRSMLPDCYYYVGRIAAKNLVDRNERFYSQYPKLIRVALDLSADMPYLEKMQKQLFRAANSGLIG
jgi:hypothetical protein